MSRRRLLRLSSSLLVLLAPALAGAAEETIEAHGNRPTKTIVIDNDRVQPSGLTMGSGDLLVFENQTLHPVQLTFVEPSDLRQKIRCGLIRGSERERARAPWSLFTWNDDKLGATIPPGRFASVCSLAKGTYAFTAAKQGLQPRQRGQGGDLPLKGQISVE
jgi:hypothetical protein